MTYAKTFLPRLKTWLKRFTSNVLLPHNIGIGGVSNRDTKEKMKLLIVREIYTKNATLGKMFIDGEFFCYTLEDTVRGDRIKVKDHTAIPAGTYKVILSVSNRFKRLMPEVLNVPMFTGIRIHGGNSDADSSGCPLVAYRKINDYTIQGTAEADLVAKMKGKDVELTIINGNLSPIS